MSFNAFFLIYTALLGLSIFALILGLVNLDVNGIRQQFRERTPVKWIGGYFLFVAFGLSAVYLMQSIAFIFTGQLPSIVTISGHPTSIVFALDLTLLVLWFVVGVLWLMKRQPWGFVVAGILCPLFPVGLMLLVVTMPMSAVLFLSLAGRNSLVHIYPALLVGSGDVISTGVIRGFSNVFL